MAIPLLPEFIPLTFSWGFFHISIHQLAHEFQSWLETIMQPCRVTEIDHPLPNALEFLPPLTLPPSKRLLVNTTSEWTACFDNGANGSDLNSMMTTLINRLGCDGLIVRASNDKRMYAAGDSIDHLTQIGFQLYKPGLSDCLGPVRSVSLTQYYGKWKFVESGIPIAGEPISQYRSREIKSRITIDTIDSICKSLGISPFDVSSYLNHGVLLDSYSDRSITYSVIRSISEAREIFSPKLQ